MKSMHQIIEEQVRRWEITRKEVQSPEPEISVVTISREPGSGGELIGEALAKSLGFDLFHQKVLHEMAKRAEVQQSMLKTLDERGVSMLEDWVSAAIHDRHIWPDEYAKLLLKVIGTIGSHGRAILIGRGANFVLPKENSLQVRVIAPFDFRVAKVSETYDISPEEAKRRVLKTESDRKAFIKKYFHTSISDPVHYDMLINTKSLSIEAAAEVISCLIKSDSIPRKD